MFQQALRILSLVRPKLEYMWTIPIFYPRSLLLFVFRTIIHLYMETFTFAGEELKLKALARYNDARVSNILFPFGLLLFVACYMWRINILPCVEQP